MTPSRAGWAEVFEPPSDSTVEDAPPSSTRPPPARTVAPTTPPPTRPVTPGGLTPSGAATPPPRSAPPAQAGSRRTPPPTRPSASPTHAARPPGASPDASPSFAGPGRPTLDFASSLTDAELANLPPLEDWPPKEILDRWSERRERYRRQRTRRRRTGVLLLALAVAATGFVLTHRGSGGPRKAVGSGIGPATGTLAWSVTTLNGRFVAVVSAATGREPVVLAIPSDTIVDVPGGGPSTIGEAGATSGLLMAAVQSTLDRRVDHFLVSDEVAFTQLVDLVGPIEVQVQSAFVWEGQALGPGPVRLSGGAALAYLDSATDEDRTTRWEDVLGGLFSARLVPDNLGLTLGLSDSDVAVKGILVSAESALVLELPTAPTDEGQLAVDSDATQQLLAEQFGAGASLVRVVVLVGNGKNRVGAQVATIISTAGYLVVGAQEAASTDVDLTQIVASTEGLVPKAEEVQGLLGVGTVYVGTQPTGVADITIVVGKDFPED